MQREDPEASERQTLRMATAVSQLVYATMQGWRAGGPQILRFFLRRGAEIKLRVRTGRATTSVAAAINCS